MEKKEIIARIKFFRKVRDISARELSLKIGKHATYVNKLELNEFSIPLDVFLQILDVLQIPLDEFFVPNFSTFGKDRALFEVINRLAPESKSAMLNIMGTLR